MMSYQNTKKAITLVELIIAISLFGLIIAGVMAFDSASREFFQSSERATDVLNELTFVLEHIQKNVMLAIGDADDSGMTLTNPRVGDYTLVIRQDINRVNGVINNTPEDYSDDRFVTYNIDSGQNTISVAELFDGAAYVPEVLTRKLFLDPNSTYSTVDFTLKDDLELQIIALALLFDISKPEDPRTNPRVEVKDQSFFPLSQSGHPALVP